MPDSLVDDFENEPNFSDPEDYIDDICDEGMIKSFKILKKTY